LTRTEPRCTAILAERVPPKPRQSAYPEPFASRMAGREKRALGDFFRLRNFGVNLTRLAPGAVSALRHAHSLQDEFVYVLEGRLTLVTDDGRQQLHRGMCVGFPAGTGNAHHVRNDSDADGAYLEVGDRSPGDSAVAGPDGWRFTHKNGEPYA
jgi:uncharacterized cupin superfamily protein